MKDTKQQYSVIIFNLQCVEIIFSKYSNSSPLLLGTQLLSLCKHNQSKLLSNIAHGILS